MLRGNLREQLPWLATEVTLCQVLGVQRMEAAPPRRSCKPPLQKWLRKGNTGCCLKKKKGRQVG